MTLPPTAALNAKQRVDSDALVSLHRAKLSSETIASRKKEALVAKGRNPLLVDPDISASLLTPLPPASLLTKSHQLAIASETPDESAYFGGMKAGTTMVFHSPYQKMEIPLRLLDDHKTIVFGEHGYSNCSCLRPFFPLKSF